MSRFSRRIPTQHDLERMSPDELLRTLMMMRRRGLHELEAVCAVQFAFNIRPAIRAKATANNNPREVDDIVSETIEQVIKSSGRPNARFRRSTAAELTAWIYEILSNIVAERHRKAERRKRIDEQIAPDRAITTGRQNGPDGESAELDPGQLDDGYALVEEEMLTDRILASLNPDHQRVVELCHIGDMSSKEAAHETGLTAANVDKILSRFRASLREALITAGLAPSGYSRSTAVDDRSDRNNQD